MNAPSPRIAEKTATDVDHYVEHLSAVSTQNEVTTTDDIYNERGVLLAKKGARLDRKLSARLIQHRLTKPLEQQVQVRNTITRLGLLDAFQAILEKYPDLREIYRSAKATQDFDLFVQTWDMPPVIAQKLTVLQAQMSAEFDKSLFSAILAYLMSRNIHADRGATLAAFTAALVHDIGMLHIDPAIVQKTGTLTPEEWRAIQGHTVVGKVVLEAIPGLDPRVSRGVLEHHERCDGTGYPFNRTDTQLNDIGQIVAITDSVYAIRAGQFQQLGRNLRDITPFLQINTGLYLTSVADSLTQLLRNSQLEPTVVNPHGDLARLIRTLRSQWQALHKVTAFLDTLVILAEKVQLGSSNAKLVKLFARLQTVLTRSGLLQGELGVWLEQLAKSPDQHSLRELVEIDLMLNELAWQLRSVHMALQQVLTDPTISALPQAETIGRMAEEMNQAVAESRAASPNATQRRDG